MSPYLIRELDSSRPEERAAIEALAREVVETGAEFVYDTVEGVLGYWIGPQTRTFLASTPTLTTGEIAGTYALKPNAVDRGSHVANAGYMVARAHRGRGLGRKLCEHSIATARELGYHAMQFNMVVSSNAALGLWHKLGFQVVGTLPGAFRHRDLGLVDAHVMYLTL